MASITVTLVRSRFGNTPKQCATLAALGLKKIRQARTFEKTDTVVGMIAKVQHLVEVTES
ncbi:MAG: 50S ribosomal protein L30 [Solidesulfovibrio sp. DCME]|uniref:50S ribosomal protein L30 n=1 Tax=Solidesulfovibrio sp. DCME TaxID=3447380 RepID=UPI003D0F749E